MLFSLILSQTLHPSSTWKACIISTSSRAFFLNEFNEQSNLFTHNTKLHVTANESIKKWRYCKLQIDALNIYASEHRPA